MISYALFSLSPCCVLSPCRAERGSPYALRIQKLAQQLVGLAQVHVDSLSATQVQDIHTSCSESCTPASIDPTALHDTGSCSNGQECIISSMTMPL